LKEGWEGLGREWFRRGMEYIYEKDQQVEVPIGRFWRRWREKEEGGGKTWGE